MFWKTGLKFLGGAGTHIFLAKYIILCILKGMLPFKMHKILFFPENQENHLSFTSKFR